MYDDCVEAGEVVPPKENNGQIVACPLPEGVWVALVIGTNNACIEQLLELIVSESVGLTDVVSLAPLHTQHKNAYPEPGVEVKLTVSPLV